MPNFTTIRICLLLAFLVSVALISAHQRVYTRNWSSSLETIIYPINGDGHLATQAYIDSLATNDFQQIDRWMDRESNRYNLPLSNPVKVSLGSSIKQLPPDFPMDATGLDTLFWGLRFRWWAYRHTPDSDSSLTQVRVFVVYHEDDQDKPLAHSLGLQKGLLGLVHAFAVDEQTAQNNIVIAHEILHTVGAVDKYESWGNPIYPFGYANPARTPLFPQRSAEIMAGRIPLSYSQSYMAESLKSVILNRYTAAEINWIDQ